MQAFEKFLQLIHSDTFCVYWLFYLGYIVILSFLGTTGKDNGKIIRFLQLSGAIFLIAGIFFPPLTVIPIIWLLPVAVIQLFTKKDTRFYNNLYCCIIPILLLVMNRSYGLI